MALSKINILMVVPLISWVAAVPAAYDVVWADWMTGAMPSNTAACAAPFATLVTSSTSLSYSPVAAAVTYQTLALSSDSLSLAPSATASSAFSTSASTVQSVASVAAAISVQPQNGSTTGSCEGASDSCVGDVTHWDGGVGACGWAVDTNSDYEIALPYAFMGSQSNGNPYCGRSVTLHNPTSGTTVQATVGDKCEGCTDRSIDCTDILFNAITDGEGDGRMHGIQWWLN
ncbi:uncharacterized protein PV07_12669 [Cladophialophora immunda]|uniref:RlpA-like protein double-psi beta-barrel domain-containing protein n=1 Tax=Cladophialophora immunda TaxID=569365 RepID=A0A0D2BU18_9EURO|nr:uncharacterized protein PV07_12669 [Cladophialophora immunda]KIW21920.1 hypothetical protein PV07_12669 [Cladophialophora immunda]